MTLYFGTAKAGTASIKINGQQRSEEQDLEGAYYEMEKIRINKDTEYILTKG